MSANPKKIKPGKDENFNVEIGDKGTDDKQIFDLNEIFHIDLSYNFDLLKNLLSTIIKNQKLKDDKLTELENQLLELRIAFNESPNKIDPNKIQSGKKEKKEKKEKKLEGSFESESLKYVLKPPKKEPVLEESDQYQPIVNNIIVSLLPK